MWGRVVSWFRKHWVSGIAIGAAVLIVWLLLSGFPLLGAVVGVLGLAGIVLASRRYDKSAREVVDCFLVFPGAFLATIAPLLLAALVLILYATQAAGVGYQIAAAVAVAAAVALTFDAEVRTARDVLLGEEQKRRWLLPVLVVVVLALPSLIAVLVFSVLPWWPGVAEIGGAPASVEWSALLLFFVAAVVRFVAFSRTSPWRFIAVVVLAFSTAMVAAIWGFLPGSDGETALGLRDSHWTLIAAVALLVVAVREAFVRLRTAGPTGIESWEEAAGDRLRVLGFTCAFAGAAGLVLALALVELEQHGFRRPSATTDVRPGMTAVPPGTLKDRQLVYTFAPVLAFEGADKEPWLPTTVNRYVQDARLVDLSGNQCPAEECKPNPRLFTLPRTCRNDAEQCYLLTCAKGDGECADEQGGVDPDHTAVYARVARREREPRTFRGVSPWGDELTLIVQYWLFYPHNRWRAVTPVGFLVQEHEGDWEAITIGLAQDRPLFAAYSAHCGGEWHRWETIEVEAATYDGSPPWRVDEDAETGLHPLVAVASGSHANYLGAWRGRPPDWGTCRGIPASATGALTYASNVRDRTGSERIVRPAFVKLVGGGHPAMAFAGRWGLSDVTSVEVVRKKRIGKVGKGPTSPALKDLWRLPVVTIFCSRHWTPRIDCGDPEAA